MALVITVNGVDKTAAVKRGTLKINRRLNGREVLTCTFFDPLSTSAAYRPQVLQDIRVVYDGVAQFDGEIKQVQDRPIVGPDRGTLTAVTANGTTELLDRLIQNAPYTSQTILDVAANLHDTILAPAYATTKGFTAPGGPTVGPLAFQWLKLQACFSQLSTITGWVFYVSPDKVLNVFAPGSTAGPITLDATNGNVKKMTWAQDAVEFFNEVWIVFGGTGLVHQNEKVNGDGSTRLFPLTGTPISAPPSTQVTIGGVTSTQPVGIYGTDNMAWTYRASDHSLIQWTTDPVLAATDYTTTAYDEQGPLVTTVSDAASIAANGKRATKIEANDIKDRAQAQAVANGILGRAKVTPQRVEIETRVQGFLPGQAMTVNFPNRNLTGTFLCEEIEINDDKQLKQTVPNFLTWVLKGPAGTTYQGHWTDYFKGQQFGAGTGASLTGNSVAGAPAGSSAALFFAYMGGATNTAHVVEGGVTRYPIHNQLVPSLTGSSISGSTQLRASVKVSDATTRCRLVFVNVTDSIEVRTGWSATGTTAYQDLLLTVTLAAATKRYRVDLEIETAATGKQYWCAYATLQNF